MHIYTFFLPYKEVQLPTRAAPCAPTRNLKLLGCSFTAGTYCTIPAEPCLFFADVPLSGLHC